MKNFRCFDKHIVKFKPITIAVGQNNAGKSTLVEALRLISLVTERYKNLRYQQVPDWLDIRGNHNGVKPSLEGIDISFDTIFYRYQGPPGSIICKFVSGEKIIVYIGENSLIHCVIFDKKGNVVKSKTQAEKVDLPIVKILPQIGPLAKEERHLIPGYVLRSMPTYLSSIHFRNQLCILYEHFKDFKDLSESHWKGLQIRTLDGRNRFSDETIYLMVRDRDFVAEVGLMGHGLQMWLQIMWFLVNSKDATTVILDEPDVYMHADLQRKLIRILKDLHPQTIITTHSIEIMSEVDPDNILIVNKNFRKSNYANSMNVVQRIVDNIGGIHNIQLARIWNFKKIILVEGNDLSILKQFHSKLYPESEVPLDIIPNMPIGGWGGWNYAIGTNMLIKTEGGEKVNSYCILDSDYHIKEEIDKRYKEAQERNVQLHIWNFKEIENYLINPIVIKRYIDERNKGNNQMPSVEIIHKKIIDLSEKIKDDIVDIIADEINRNQQPRPGLPKSNKKARKIVNDEWNIKNDFIKFIPGKDILKDFSKWLVDEYSTVINPFDLAKMFRPDEIHPEIKMVINSIENNKDFIKL